MHLHRKAFALAFVFVITCKLDVKVRITSYNVCYTKLLRGLSYAQFVIPGLILMGVVNNAFANSSTSLFMSRYLGSIVDLLVTPLTPAQFILAYTLAAMLRGMVVGTVVWLISLAFASLPWAHPLLVLAMALLTSFLFAQFGLIVAIYADSFDALAMYSNFVLLPLIYLGGVFRNNFV